MPSSPSSKRACPMDEHERFVKFYEVIPETFRSYVANVVWPVGLLSAANGWLISSESSRAFVGDSKPVYVTLILVVFIIGVLHTASCLMFYRASQEKITQLTSEYKDLHPLLVRHYEISKPLLIVNLLLSWSLVISLIILATATQPNAFKSFP